MIGARTKLVALLGNPVGHSLSPLMQNAAFRHLGVDVCYLAFQIERKDFHVALKGLRALGALGANITIPFKEEAFKAMDWIDPQCRGVGAVNTVIFRKGALCGYNTDVFGVKKSLEKLGPQKETALLLGAGGAARAAAIALIEVGYPFLFVANRNEERAKKLKEDLLACTVHTSIHTIAWQEIPRTPYDVLINATSLGLEENPWPKEDLEHCLEPAIKKEASVLDLVYLPYRETELVRKAREKRLAVLGGKEVLLFQGVESFRLFVGIKAPYEVMESALHKAQSGGGVEA